MIVACKHRHYAAVYKAERLSVYAFELIFAYKATKQDKIMQEQRLMEEARDARLKSMQEQAIRDTIMQSLDKTKQDAIIYLNKKTGTDQQIDQLRNQ